MKNARKQSRGQIKKVVRSQLLSLMEPKFVDTAILTTNITAAGAISGITLIAQGVAQSQRTGDSITLSSIYLNYKIGMANADIYTTSRIIIFQWHPTEIVGSPVVGTILQNPGTTAVISQYNFQNRDSFTILYDRIHPMAGVTASPTSTSAVAVMNHKLGRFRKTISFAPGSNSVSTNQLIVLYICDSAITPFPILDFNSRVCYLDG